MPGAWIDLDLSTAVFHVSSGNTYGQYATGTISALSSHGPDYYFPGLTFNDADTYEFEVTSSDVFGVGMEIRRDTSSSDADWLDFDRYFVLGGFSGTSPGTFTMGPGVEEWDDAVAAGGHEHYNFSHGNAQHITAIRYRNMTETPAPTVDASDGLELDGPAGASFEPAIVATPARFVNLAMMDTARALQVVEVGPTGQPYLTAQDARIPRTRDRIKVGGVDITYFRGVNTPTPEYRLIKPLLWGSATLILPQVNPQFEVIGDNATGVLHQFRRDVPVEIERVDTNTGEVYARDWVGFIDAINTSGPVLTLTLAGYASGRCARQNYVPTPVFRRKHDLSFQILDFLRRRGIRTKRGGDIGIPMYDRGGTDGLTHINELSAFAVTPDGTTYDIVPVTGKVFDVVETDRETVDFTFYPDSSLITQDLDQAFSEEVDEVYATSHTRSGELIAFIDAPGLVQGNAPEFPGSTLELGDSGDDVVLIYHQLSLMNFLNYEDADDESYYDQDVADAVAELQEEAGLATVAVADGFLGKVNELTWDILWNLQDLNSYSIDRARQRPAAQKRWVPKWNRTANGGKLSRNKDYDPHGVPNSVVLDLGVFNRRRTKRFARSRLTPQNQSNWQGTVTFTGAVIRGEHTPGDPITADDVMPHRDIKPGMNGLAPLFDGGTLFHVSGTSYQPGSGSSPEQTTAIMDTQARDTMPAWEAITRNRETRSNPARAWSGHVRGSSVRHDVMTDWTDICGNLAHKVALVHGWNQIVVPAGQEGVIQKVHLQLEDPAEFAVLLTEKNTDLNALNSRIDAPLTDPRPDARPWWERDAVVDWLEGRGLLDAWGTEGNPCGWGRSLKTDDQGPTAEPLTGEFIEWAGLNYTCAEPGRLYLYVWVDEANNLLPGRLLTQQLTTVI